MVLVVYRGPVAVQPYAAALEAAGAQPLLEEAKVGITLGKCSGLLLTGGTDVDPTLYGEVPRAETEAADTERDAVEGALIDEAIARDIPLLAIRRGIQMLNVRLGGSLIQHLPGTPRHVWRTPERGLPAHKIAIEPADILSP